MWTTFTLSYIMVSASVLMRRGNRKKILTSRLSFFFQAEDGIRDLTVTGVQTCALPILGLGEPEPEGDDAFWESLLTPQRLARIEAVVGARLCSVTVVLDRLLDAHNVAAVLRTAEGLGVARVHVVPHDARDDAAHRRVTQDAHKWLDVETHASGAQAARALAGLGFAVYAGHLDPLARPSTEIAADRPVA